MFTSRNQRKRPGILADEGGQAITEAALMMSLFTASWVLLSVVCFMSSNGVRAASAARSLAWCKAHDRYTSGEMESRFFHYMGMTGEIVPGSLDRLALTGMALDPIISIFVTQAFGVWQADATFGPGPTGSNRFPFSPLQTTFPLQHEKGFMPEWQTVSSHCEWAYVNDNWDQGIAQALSSLLN